MKGTVSGLGMGQCAGRGGEGVLPGECPQSHLEAGLSVHQGQRGGGKGLQEAEARVQDSAVSGSQGVCSASGL